MCVQVTYSDRKNKHRITLERRYHVNITVPSSIELVCFFLEYSVNCKLLHSLVFQNIYAILLPGVTIPCLQSHVALVALFAVLYKGYFLSLCVRENN